jgi:gas vesicle protein
MSKQSNIALGIVLAAAAGYVAGVLTAPKSGKETRKDISDAAKKGKNELERQLKRAQKELSELLAKVTRQARSMRGRAKTEVDKLVESAKDTKNKVVEALDAARKGESTDEDLDKAVRDAEDAIVNLKKFLQK